jgi:DNA-directed RNA polymerase specialized sigma24 family protein
VANGEDWHDPPLEALEELAAELRNTVERSNTVLARLEHVREYRRRGVRYRDIPPPVGPDGERPQAVAVIISESLAGLVEKGARFRREMVAALHADGLSTTAIAEIFGVSRQRVSALLAEAAQSLPGKRNQSGM